MVEVIRNHKTWPHMAEYIVSTYPKHSPEYDDAEMFLAVLNYFHNNLDQFKDRMEARGWSVG